MPERERKQDTEPRTHYDGRREGVLNDPLGAQYGIHMDKKSVHPEEIKEVREENMKNTLERNDRIHKP